MDTMHTVLGLACVLAATAAGAWLRARAENRRASATAERLRRELEAVTTGLSSGLMVVDADGGVRALNRAGGRILSCDRESVVGAPLGEAFGDGWREFTACLGSALARRERVERREVRVRPPEGGSIPVGVTVNTLPEVDGSTTGVVAVFQDLTEVTDLRERMREADRLAAVGELAAAIAHEIRNPLGSIRGSAEILASESGADPRLLDLILRESGRVNRLISDFLVYARQRDAHPTLVQVEELLQDVALQTAMHRGTDDPALMRVSCDPSDLILEVDEEQIRQVLLNLCLNAVQMGGEAVRIELMAELEADEICRIRVRDDGPGIPPEVADTLFDPFVTSRPGGTGLGLATAHRVIVAHGGRMEAVNVPDGGAEVGFRLPLLDTSRRRKREAALV